MAKTKKPKARQVETYTHGGKRRANNPPVGLVNPDSDPGDEVTTYEYDPTLDPQLVWAGKAEHTSFDVPTVSLHVHERIEPSTILRAVRKKRGTVATTLGFFEQPDQKLSAAKALEFYKHPQGWANRLIAGDSLLVMNSLIEKEAMAGKVQMVYFDPPYGIKYGSNFQPFVSKRSATDGKDDDLTTEPEMVKAFRDTWELGLHSYLSHLRDRALLARELLASTGSIFVQISEENLHHVKEILDEVFGPENFVSLITFKKTSGTGSPGRALSLPSVSDYLVWYCRDKSSLKYRYLFADKQVEPGNLGAYTFVELPDGKRRRMTSEERANLALLPKGSRIFRADNLTSQSGVDKTRYEVEFEGQKFKPPGSRVWATSKAGMDRLRRERRLIAVGNTLSYVRYLDDFPVQPISNLWDDTTIAGYGEKKVYVVQTNVKVVERCLLMTTDPGDLALDITCGSGTTAVCAEKWGRRWITCDSSRIAITLARTRIMGLPFDYYELAHESEGVASGFAYQTAPHVRLREVANDEPVGEEILYDRPKVVKNKVRVSGPFTVEAVPAPSVKPLDGLPSKQETGKEATRHGATRRHADWRQELLQSGIRGQKGQKLDFSRLEPVSGSHLIHAVGEGKDGQRVAVTFGPEYHPLPPNQVELALKEARLLDPRPDVLVLAAFEFDPEAAHDIDEMSETIAGMALVKAKMNSDLLTGELKKKRSSNESFFFIGQPDATLRQIREGPDEGKWVVEAHGYDYFDVVKGELVSGDARKIAMWMLDPDYDDRSLYPHQIFFPMRDSSGGWTRLASSLKAELDADLMEKYSGAVSLPFELGKNQRVAIKIIDDRGIESIKVLEP